MCKCSWLLSLVLVLPSHAIASPILGSDAITEVRPDRDAELEQSRPFTTIPEPSSLALMGLCAAAGVIRFQSSCVHSIRRAPNNRRDQ